MIGVLVFKLWLKEKEDVFVNEPVIILPIDVIVTIPLPSEGSNIIPDPATIRVTPPLLAYEALKEYDDVPSKEPVTPEVTFNEFKVASEPLVTIFFQFGILFL
jgi:hypothetical protein